jgi:hypothetical protein
VLIQKSAAGITGNTANSPDAAGESRGVSWRPAPEAFRQAFMQAFYHPLVGPPILVDGTFLEMRLMLMAKERMPQPAFLSRDSDVDPSG